MRRPATTPSSSRRCGRGDEAAFTALVDELTPALMRVALMHVASRAVAEDVVADTWLGVIKGIDRFEGRSALRTWIFQILLNIARTRGKREKRTLPFASLRRRAEEGRDEPAVDADRFQGRNGERPAPGRGRRRSGMGSRRRLESDETRDVAPRRDPGPAAAPARRDRAARHPGLFGRGGAKRSGPQRDQPESAPAPGPLEGASGARGAHGGREPHELQGTRRARNRLPRGAAPGCRRASSSRRTSARATAAAAYIEQMRLTLRALGRIPEETVPAAARDELIARFRELRASA